MKRAQRPRRSPNHTLSESDTLPWLAWGNPGVIINKTRSPCGPGVVIPPLAMQSQGPSKSLAGVGSRWSLLDDNSLRC